MWIVNKKKKGGRLTSLLFVFANLKIPVICTNVHNDRVCAFIHMKSAGVFTCVKYGTPKNILNNVEEQVILRHSSSL